MRPLWRRILVQYARMSGTVVIAVVFRLVADSVAIVLVGLNPEAEDFWFSRCETSSCVFVGITELVLCILGSSAFVWRWHEVLVDPSCNRWAHLISWNLIIGACEWMPISVFVAKSNLIVEYIIKISGGAASSGFFEAMVIALCSSTAAAALTHHYLRERTLSPNDYWNFTALLFFYSLGWAVGWSYWDATLRLLQALDSTRSAPQTARVIFFGVIIFACVIYLRFGPEPVIPQSSGRNWDKPHSFSRSWLAFQVYSSVVMLVMCLSDPTYGYLHQCCRYFYPNYVFPHETFTGLGLFSALSLAWSFVAVALSVQITQRYGVDMLSSIRLSRQQVADGADTSTGELWLETEEAEARPSEIKGVVVGCCLLYDVMGLVTAFAWGQVVTGGLSLLRPIVRVGAIMYMLTVVIYAFGVVSLIAKGARLYFPSDAERLKSTSAQYSQDSQDTLLYQELSPREITPRSAPQSAGQKVDGAA